MPQSNVALTGKIGSNVVDQDVVLILGVQSIQRPPKVDVMDVTEQRKERGRSTLKGVVKDHSRLRCLTPSFRRDQNKAVEQKISYE